MTDPAGGEAGAVAWACTGSVGGVSVVLMVGVAGWDTGRKPPYLGLEKVRETRVSAAGRNGGRTDQFVAVIGVVGDTSQVDVPELIVGGLVGAVLGVFVTAALRPRAATWERRSRKAWDDDPVIVTVVNDRSIIWAGYPDWIGDTVYVKSRRQLDGTPPGDRDGWAQWARSQGAVDANRTHFQVYLQAKVEALVWIQSVNVQIHSRKPVKRGAVLLRGVGGASVQPRQFRIELDSQTVTWLDGGGQPGEPLKLKMPAGDGELFFVWAETHEPVRFEWSIVLNLLVEGRQVRRTIDNDGAPFVTVGGGDLPVWWNTAGDQWTGPSGVQSDGDQER